MKYLFLFLAPLFYGNLFGQQPTPDNPGTPEQRAQMMTDSMTQHLKLRPDQINPVQELNLKYAQIMEKEVIKSARNTLSKYWKGLEINTEKELKKLLDAGQWALYEQYRKKVMKKIWARIF
jgi:hypothetical protein